VIAGISSGGFGNPRRWALLVAFVGTHLAQGLPSGREAETWLTLASPKPAFASGRCRENCESVRTATNEEQSA
jgi:hypothetical protein